MARIKYGSIVAGVSGSIGSATFQKSSFGDTLRNKPRPRRSGTAIQMTRRNYMMELHGAWAALTDQERTLWNQFISYSSTKIRRDKNVMQSGHSLFIQYNYLRLLSGFAILTVPGYQVLPENSNIVGLQYFLDTTLAIEVNYSGWPADQWACYKLSAPRKSSLSFSRRGLRFMAITSQADDLAQIKTAYLAAFGSIPPEGSTIHYEVRYFGMLSPIMSGIYTGKLIVVYEAP